MEKLYDLWAKRNPEWERRFEESIFKTFADYGKGNTSLSDSRGKIFGAGYEMYIIAFFIGLYFNQTRKLVEDRDERKSCGQAIQYWGNIETRGIRQTYGAIREYMFAALIARTDIDLIALDKGDSKVTVKKVVDALIDKMEEYANFGFYYIEEQMIENPDFFFKDKAFLRVFMQFMPKASDNADDDSSDDEPEEL
jgi:hypothetical protein